MMPSAAAVLTILASLGGSDLLSDFRQGPMKDVDEIVFCVHRPLPEHWYANFGYYADAAATPSGTRPAYLDGGRLCRLNLRSGQLKTLLDDPKGGIRDPVVHYDARRILFSYRPGGTEHYHLYEIRVDGSGLRRLTDGPFDDFEPVYLPDDGILFVSSRCKRWVNCWLTQVAVLYRCDADGRNIRAVSGNTEQDNSPWIMPSGQILYTRWEYVDRSQVNFHHLWISTPDGARQTVFYGNMHPGTVMIDAKPIPGSPKIVASFSPGHGQTEHAGRITVVDPRRGPDDQSAARVITQDAGFRDPWAFSETAFLAAHDARIELLDGAGQTQTVYQLPPAEARNGLQCRQPRPLLPRARERAMPELADWSRDTGRLIVANVYQGRNMGGVRPGDIKKLLVLELLPKPINFTGGMEPISYGGTFTLERVLGTVPVEADGSAYLEVPAQRSVFFVALDEHDLSVKRMQSFMSLMPGETTTCIGCHEQRTLAPQVRPANLAALRRGPSKIEPLVDVPDVMDFPRDVQPILDRHCLPCHDCDRRAGGIALSGDRGPVYSISYATITAQSLVADGRNGYGNRPPRTIGSSASRLLKLADGTHHAARLTDLELRTLRLWIDSGAPYPGTYAALGSGMLGGYAENRLDRGDLQWPSTLAAAEMLKTRCGQCHSGPRALPLTVSDESGHAPWEGMGPDDPQRHYCRHLLYDLTRPEKSLLLSAPLAIRAGGFQSCGKAVFADTSDDAYRKILAAIQDAKRKLDQIKRFDMPGFRPRPEYLREMRRFGILPDDTPHDAPVNVYELDRNYWQSLWYRAMAIQ
ncbi:MAG: hypothetical protein ABSG68_14170 [Thermoguttaceae bacterium]|jgi:hypothetical protein